MQSQTADWLRAPVPVRLYGHGIPSLNLAIGRAYCGATSSMSAYPVANKIAESPADDGLPIRELTIFWAGGSLDAYCASLAPFTNNENSLMLLESVMLRLGRRVSMIDLGSRFRLLRLALLTLFCIALLREGASLALATGLVLVALDLQRLLEPGQSFAEYSFVLPFVLAGIGLYSLGRRAVGASVVKVAILGAVMGWLGAFIVNLRSTYLPMVWAMQAIFMASVLWRDRAAPSSDRRRLFAALAAPFVVAYVAFQALFIWSMPTSGVNYTYHTIAHPLVLGLAVPRNRLAESEGIEWLDKAGVPLAQRMDPSATYLGPTYEHALFAYYFKLWREHPYEMLDIYRAKAMLAGTGIIKSDRSGRSWGQQINATPGAIVGVSMTALGVLRNGVAIFLALVTALGVLLWLAVIRGRPLALPFAMVVLVASMVLIEAIVIMPEFRLMYQAPLVLGMAALPMLAAQAALDGLAWVVAGSWRRGRPVDVMTSPDLDRTARQTIADFGDQWRRFSDNSGFFGSPALFDDVFGPLVDRLAIAGTRVADLGAGAGRFVNVLIDAGAEAVVAIEPSAAFDVLRQNTAVHGDRITYLQTPGDAIPAGLDLDYVFSIGVLHHIPDPAPVVRAALSALRRGGTIAIWLYGREGNAAYLCLAFPLRVITSRLPHPMLWAVTCTLDPLLLCYAALCRVAPLPLHEYMRDVVGRLSGDKRRLVVYDQLNPAYARYYTKAEAISLLEDAGFVDVRTYHRHGYSWALTGRRP